MTRKSLITLAVLAGMTAGPTSPARAELPLDAYDSMRREAAEALLIEVEAVTTREIKPAWTEVVLTARVVSVERSKSGLKKGGKVTIRYESLDQDKLKEPIVGPTPIPILKKGDFYPAFLDREKGKPHFEPAAAGMSFLMTPAI